MLSLLNNRIPFLSYFECYPLLHDFTLQVMPNSEAENLGIKEGDQILKVNNIDFSTLDHAEVNQLIRLNIGIVFNILDNAKEQLIKIKLICSSHSILDLSIKTCLKFSRLSGF